VLFVVYCFPYGEHGLSETWFHSYLAGYARMAGGLISLIDPTAQVLGTEIHGRYAVKIVKSCDAMETNILFSAAVLAFPSTWQRRIVALLLGLALLGSINLLRIFSLYVVGLIRPGAVEVLHLDIWPMVMVAAATLAFLGAAVFLRKAREEAAPC
jgi:exosortase/archaeosortase family protein